MKIAIVGMGPSWNAILDIRDEYDEVWSINYYYEMPGVDPDRVYDVHDLYFYRDSMDKVPKHIKHWEEHLTQPKDFRFFAPLPYPEVPDLEIYPIDKVVPLLKDFRRMKEDGGVEYIKFWTSSFDYLMSAACAELDEGDEVHLFGWTMGWDSKRNETEYQYQLPGLCFWTGYALGKGISVYVDKKVPIFKSRMYTYEGASVMTIQTLETFKGGFELQMQQATAEFHTEQGKYAQFMEQYNKTSGRARDLMKEEATRRQHGMNQAMEKVIRSETASQVIQHLLDNVDMAELNTEIESEMIRVVDGEIAKALRGEDGVAAVGDEVMVK